MSKARNALTYNERLQWEPKNMSQHSDLSVTARTARLPFRLSTRTRIIIALACFALIVADWSAALFDAVQSAEPAAHAFGEDAFYIRPEDV